MQGWGGACSSTNNSHKGSGGYKTMKPTSKYAVPKDKVPLPDAFYKDVADDKDSDADEQEDFEADLDLGDCLPQPKSDILEQYRLQMINSATTSSSHILRPTTPGQRKWVLTITNHYLLRE